MKHDTNHAKKTAAPKEPTAADIWADEAYAMTAKAMATWLKASVNLSRPIASLTRDEMTRLATCAVTIWIGLASHRVLDETISEDERQKLSAILM